MVFSRDTSLEAERVQVEVLRRMPPARRLAIMDELNSMAVNLTLAGLRERWPGAPAEEIKARYLELILGHDLATRVLEARRARAGSRTDAGGQDAAESN